MNVASTLRCLLFAGTILINFGCGQINEATSSLAVVGDPCIKPPTKLSAVLELNLGNMQFFRFQPDACGGSNNAASPTLGLTDEGAQESDLGPVILIGYGNKDLQFSGPDYVYQGDDGKFRSESGSFSEKQEWEGFKQAQDLLPENTYVLPLYNKSPAEIESAIATERAKNPEIWANKTPMVSVIGHGYNDDNGAHNVVYTPDLTPGAPPKSIPSVDILRSVDSGLGGKTQFCYASANCSAGGVLDEIEKDPKLSENILSAIAASKKEQLAFSAGDPLEQNMGDILRGFNSDYGSANDPTRDGKYTLADHLRNAEGKYEGKVPQMTSVYLPFKGEVPVEPNSDLGVPVGESEEIPPEEGGVREAYTETPNGNAYFPATYRTFTYRQDPQEGGAGNPENIVLSRYDETQAPLPQDSSFTPTYSEETFNEPPSPDSYANGFDG